MTTQAHSEQHRDGFTLIEIIIAIAIVAILAGAVAPLAFKELVRAREEATEKELAAIEDGLLDFYEDTGRFPTEAEGLAALVRDPGVAGWSGPYVDSDRGDPALEVSEDSFGNSYSYDLAPVTNPGSAADLIVVSGGADHNVSFGSVGATWNLDTDGDDLLALVSRGPLNREKLKDAQLELAALGEASRRYYEERAGFTTDPQVLADGYLDEGLGNDALEDPWRNRYQMSIDTGGDTPLLEIVSYGPDQQDDGGGDDDLVIEVSSLAPGRKATRYLLDIAQTVLNGNADLVLSGNWDVIRQNLGLDEAFLADGWGRDFEINTDSRTIFSTGPDGDADTTTDNIPVGVGPAAAG